MLKGGHLSTCRENAVSPGTRELLPVHADGRCLDNKTGRGPEKAFHKQGHPNDREPKPQEKSVTAPCVREGVTIVLCPGGRFTTALGCNAVRSRTHRQGQTLHSGTRTPEGIRTGASQPRPGNDPDPVLGPSEDVPGAPHDGRQTLPKRRRSTARGQRQDDVCNGRVHFYEGQTQADPGSVVWGCELPRSGRKTRL